jgi:4-amino-4-deoxychorismate lyase
MGEIITLNGKRFLNKKILRTLIYGEGVFETFRYNSKLPLLIKNHYERLIKGAKLLKIPKITYEDYLRYIEETVKQSDEKDLYVKTILTSEGNTYFPLQPESSNLLVIVKPYSPIKEEKVKLTVAPFKVHSSDPLLRIKSTNYARNIIAKRYAFEKGCFDAIFLNENNEVTETSSANIFWIKGKYLYTPSVSCGLLEGITRKYVIEKAKKEGFIVIEGRFYLNDVKNADIIFLTNSLNGIIRVSSIV